MKTFTILAIARAASIVLFWLIELSFLMVLYPGFVPIFRKIEAKHSLPFLTSCYLNVYQWVISSYGLAFILFLAVLIAIDFFCHRYSERTRKYKVLCWILFATILLSSFAFFVLLQISLILPVYRLGEAAGA